MGAWRLYDYVDNRGLNDFEAWSRGLEKPDRARLSQKLRMLETVGPELPPQLLAGPIKGQSHIYKLRINGRVALRPLLCKGPISNDEEFTLLKGATEVDRKWEPRNAPFAAETRRQEILRDPTRRCNHVRVD
jgi:hypothetical protein